MTETLGHFSFFLQVCFFFLSLFSDFCPIGDIIVEVQRIFLYNG